MKKTLSSHRRLILGMSIEDAQSKFDSPESRAALRLAHERYNQGLYHELNLAQRLRNKLPGERKFHLVRHTKPTVKGFQAYVKSSPDDYVVRELWLNKNNSDASNETTDNAGERNTDGSFNSTSTAHSTNVTEAVNGAGSVWVDMMDDAPENQLAAHQASSTSNSITASDKAVSSARVSTTYIGRQLGEEIDMYSLHRNTVLTELSRVAKTLSEEAKRQLVMRRGKGYTPSTRHLSVVERLIDDVREAEEKGCTNLSSSSQLLEPLGLALNVCTRRDKRVLEAFRSPLLCVPAEEYGISLSLWVAGAVVEDSDFSAEFPYYIARHADIDLDDVDSLPPPNSVPKANIDVYFSLELYKLQKSIGMDGVLALRRFIGRAMMRQHDPLPTAPSILLNMQLKQRESGGLCSGESTQIPWLHVIRAKVASITGTVLQISSDDAPSTAIMREAVGLVWKVWGNLVKDLHVHGDLDYLYVSVRPKVEVQVGAPPAATLIGKGEEGLLQTDQIDKGPNGRNNNKKNKRKNELAEDTKGNAAREVTPRNDSLWKGYKSRKPRGKAVFLNTDFVVIECILEKRGLPHRLVVEDLTESLVEMQRQAMEVQRLSIIDEAEQQNRQSSSRCANEDEEALSDEGVIHGTSDVRPVLYAPAVTVSHAGVIDASAHSFQRIRIRGSCLAHVEALARALGTGEHFIDREGINILPNNSNNGSAASLLHSLPPNLHFSNTHSDRGAHEAGRRLLGHRVPRSYATAEQRSGSGYYRIHQTLKPMQHMIADQEERDFWREHYYRLFDIKLIFHDRISAADLNDSGQWSAALKEKLMAIGRQRSKLDEQDDETDDTAVVEVDEVVVNGRKKRPRKVKSKRLPPGKLEEIVSTISPEKVFEYLCVDMEALCASYDLRVGDNDGYDYRVKLRRIPQSHFSLVRPAMASLEKHGFINYFGPQRFSSYTKYNMHPGLHLLKGEFHAAASIVVQQFHMDADLAAEKRRNGQEMTKMYGSKGAGFHLPDRNGSSGRGPSAAGDGSALQSILKNALQASSLLGFHGDVGCENNSHACRDGKQIRKVTNGSSALDPCAEAFLRVVGPKVCSMLVHEFVAFLWNDIVNQRLQRYGTFAILPGDLVRRNALASPHSHEYGHVVYASKKDIERGIYSCYDVVLPVPGAGVQLPDNHTTDLYIVTLKRMGILFNPESRQWDVFRSQRHFEEENASGTNGATNGSAPHHRISTAFALMEEELCGDASAMDFAHHNTVDDMSSAINTASSTALTDGSGLRHDLRRKGSPGNPLGVNIWCSYRHMLINPATQLTWHMDQGLSGDPYQRWALSVRNTFEQKGANSLLTPGSAAVSVARGKSEHQPQQGQLLFLGGTAAAESRGKGNGSVKRRASIIPPTPYWLPRRNDGCLCLSFQLPFSVYPSMLLREITKSDVNSPDVVDLDRPLIDTRAESWSGLSADKQKLYKKFLAKKRQKLFAEAPRAINIALLHQHIFRNGGMRRGLLPSMRGYDDVSK